MHRISSFAAGRRSKWIVIAIWIVLGIGFGQLQPKLQDVTTDEPEEFLPESADSTRVQNMLEEQFPGGADTPALLVYERPQGKLTKSDRKQIAADVQELSKPGVLTGVGKAVVPFTPAGAVVNSPDAKSLVSEDGTTAAAIIPLQSGNSDRLLNDVDKIRDQIKTKSMVTHVTGAAGLTADSINIFNSIDITLLLVTGSLVLILLLLIYRSPLIALIPLVVVGLAYSIVAGIIYLLVDAGSFKVSGQTTSILIVLMFGAGTDYCLLIVSRYREELRRFKDKHAAMAHATAKTAPAILSAGGTVIAAMLVLLLADLRSTKSLGPTLSIGIAVMVLAGLTLLPAILSAAGRRSFWPVIPNLDSTPRKKVNFWGHVGRRVQRAPLVSIVVVVIVLLAGALGNLKSEPALSFGEGFRKTTDSELGQNILDKKLDPGQLAPVIVITDKGDTSAVVKALKEDKDVSSAMPVQVSTDGKQERINAVLTVDPFSGEATNLIPSLRTEVSDAAPGELAIVGGQTAQNYDTDHTLKSDAQKIVPSILVVIFLILIFLLRALIAPLYLIITVVLSFAFALGTSKLIFSEIFGMDAFEPSLGTYAFIFLVALGVDYNIFLISRIREESIKKGVHQGVLSGLEHTGTVISSAGLILAGTFAALAAVPLDSLLQIGFTVAFGVLVDTFVVRTILVPAIAFKAGKDNWWPGKLAVQQSTFKTE